MQGYPFFLPSHADHLISSVNKKDIVDFDICIESFKSSRLFMSTRYNNVRPTRPASNDEALPNEMTVKQFIEMFIRTCKQGGLTNVQEHERFIRLSREFCYDPGATKYNTRFDTAMKIIRRLYNKEIGAPEDQALGYRKTDVAAIFLDDDEVFWVLYRKDAVELTDGFVLRMNKRHDTPVYDVLYTLKYYPKHAYYRIFFSHVAPTFLGCDEGCIRNREQFMKPLTMLQFFFLFAPGLVPNEHMDMYKDCWHIALSEFRKDRR